MLALLKIFSPDTRCFRESAISIFFKYSSLPQTEIGNKRCCYYSTRHALRNVYVLQEVTVFLHHSIYDNQGCLSFPAGFFDSSKLIPLHSRNSFPEIFGKLRQSRMWPLHFIKNRYRKIPKVTQNNPAYQGILTKPAQLKYNCN